MRYLPRLGIATRGLAAATAFAAPAIFTWGALHQDGIWLLGT